MSRPRIDKWYWQLKARQESLEDDEPRGIPVTAQSDTTIAHVKNIICTDRQIMADAEKVGVSHKTYQRILKSCAWPHGSKHRTKDELNETAAISGVVISMADSELKMLDRIITGDEMWCHLYDPQTKRQ
jgi:hypothetical protein